MAWARLDDRWHDHPKVSAAGLEAAGLWTMCLTWAHANRRKAKRPGVVPRAVIARFAGAKATKLTKTLVEVGLFDVVDDGWKIHDFEEYLAKYDPKKAAEAGRRGAMSRWRSDDEPPPEPDGDPPYDEDGESSSDRQANRWRNDSEPMARADVGASARRNPDPKVLTGHQSPPVTEVTARGRDEGGPMANLISQVRAVRPFWSPAAISAAARRCAEIGRTYEATLAALLAVADDPATVTAGRVVADGPWWRPPTERTTRSTTDERVAQGLALAEQIEAMGQRPLLRALPAGAA